MKKKRSRLNKALTGVRVVYYIAAFLIGGIFLAVLILVGVRLWAVLAPLLGA